MMKFKDIIKLSFKNIVRKKKRTILTILLLSVLSFFCFICLTFNNTFEQYKYDFYYKNYSGKEYLLNLKYNEINIDELKEKLKTVKNIKEVIKNSERLTTTTINVKNSVIGTGSMTLYGASKNTLPKIILGQSFSNNNIQLICPTKFLLNEIEELFTNNYIDLTNTIGKKITLFIDEYDLSTPKRDIIKTHQYEAEIIGLYDAQANSLSSDICFSNFDFIKEVNQINKYTLQDSLVIVIDDYRNFDKVNQDIKLILEDFNLMPTWKLDTNEIDFFQSIIRLTLMISFVIGIFCEIIIILKKMKKETKDIGLYKTIGYDSKTIIKISYIENLIILLISLLIGFILNIITINIINILALNTYHALLNFEFSLPFFPILLISISFIIIISIVFFINLNAINKNNPSKLLRN